MRGQGGGRYLPQTTVASVILILCTLAQSLTCLSLQGLSKNVEQETIMEARTGSILFNGKALDFLDSGNGDVLGIDTDQADGTGMFLGFFSVF